MPLFPCIAVTLLSGLALTAQVPTSTQAVALVKSAVAYAKQNGVDRLVQETNDATGKYHVASGGELYVFVYDMRGVVRAIGFNTAALVGRNRYDLKDSEGVPFIQKMIELAQTKGKGWVDYKYPNPTTNLPEQKTSYIEYYEGVFIGSGIYKEPD